LFLPFVVPGVERQPLKKLEPDATALLRLVERWRSEAVRAGRPITRVALAYELQTFRYSGQGPECAQKATKITKRSLPESGQGLRVMLGQNSAGSDASWRCTAARSVSMGLDFRTRGEHADERHFVG
jgi:hypothetical protein